MKTKKTLLLILGVLLAAAVVVGLIFGVKALIKAGQTPDVEPVSSTADQPATDEPTTGNTVDPTAETEPEDPDVTAVKARDFYTLDDVAADDPRFDEVVAVCGDYELTNRQAAVFYGMQYVAFINQLSQYGMSPSDIGLDMSKPLKDQLAMDGEMNWEQYFLLGAMKEFETFAASATAANKASYELPETERKDLESFLSKQAAYAAREGFDSVDAYLQDSFGPAVRFEDYENYLRLYFQAMSYENSLYLGIEPSDEDLEAYRAAHADSFADVDAEEKAVNVRHILFLSDRDEDGTATDEEKAEAKAKADAILAEYLTDPSEERFTDLALENSEDPGSVNNGGLYEGVRQGQMVASFNDWCFDESRQPGDYGIVETEYGYHVMYFVSSDLLWKSTARHQIRKELTDPMVEEIHSAYTAEIDYDKLILAPLPLPEATE